MKLLVLGLLTAGAIATAQAAIVDVNFAEGGLTGLAAVPPNASTATGGEVGPIGLRYDDVTNQLDVNLAYGLFGFNPLQGDYTVSHIHQAPAGSSGGVVADLAPIHSASTANSGFYSGSVFLTPAAETALYAGELYINIHSTFAPGGEIRGQLTVVPEPATVGLFSALGLIGFAGYRRRRNQA